MVKIMKNKNIVVVDDDKSIRLVLTTALNRAGFNVKFSGTTSGLWNLIESEKIDILITDVGLPDGDSLDILPKIQKIHPYLKIIVISAKSTLITAVRAEKKGAFYYLPKPFDLDEIISLVNKIINTNTFQIEIKETNTFDNSVTNIYESGPIIGKSKIMQDTYKLIARLVSSNLTILISGESGTGKKLVARAIHDLSDKSSMPFMKITMSEVSILNSSYNKSIKNDKNYKTKSKLSNLNGGTLLIDEIGESTFLEQTELLKFLENNSLLEMTNFQEEEIKPRIILSTRKNLLDLVKEGKFRDDLYYKVNVVPINLPALRDRIEDIPALVEHFIKLSSKNYNDQKHISLSALKELSKFHWPGNVQELKNFVGRLFLITSDNVITSENIHSVINNKSSINIKFEKESIDEVFKNYVKKYFLNFNFEEKKNLHDTFLQKIENPLITEVLKYTRGNQIKASRILGFNRNTLRKKIKELEIEVKKVRKNSV